MMRPYLAVIRDSFREALASRVLWILLVVITLFLVALVPFGITQQLGSYLSDEDLLDPDKLVEQIAAEGKSPAPSPGRRIWGLLPQAAKDSLATKPSEPFARRTRANNFAQALRELIERRDLYEKTDWAKARFSGMTRS